MRVAVAGLWHLGSVTAACLASAGHTVVGVDADSSAVGGLSDGRAPVFEPGLDALLTEGLAAGRLRFSTDPASVADADVLWITYDTPVDDDDRADVDGVITTVEQLLARVTAGTLVLVSSQLPVGSVARLEAWCEAHRPHDRISFACLPENLRLGHALKVFREPDRVVAGVREPGDRARIAMLLAPMTTRLEWMHVESAEMAKHALNAFLATSVAFANEVATLCEVSGADAKEVERALKTESRIGPGAYLSPGAAFAGGTLARDVTFLTGLAAAHGQPARLLASARESNDAHKAWAARRLMREFGGQVRGRRIAVWGLTYKPGTNTLRRSSSVELCTRLHEAGAEVRAFDPAVRELPVDLRPWLAVAPTAVAAVTGADALVVATGWPEFREIAADAIVAAMPSPRVLDAARHLAPTLGSDARIHYISVGQGGRR